MFFLATQNVPVSNAIAKSACTRDICTVVALIVLSGLCASSSTAAPFDAAAIHRAFSSSCGGYSSDELLIRDDLRQRFLNALSDADAVSMSAENERAALLGLLQLRKSGKLTPRATRRGSPVDDLLLPVAEIAVRVVTDRHRITSDIVLADPNFRRELQREAEILSPGIDAYSVRKAVLSLRKRRALRPELVLRVADWGRELKTMSMADLKIGLKQGTIPKKPGVYLFRSAEGYLYIGEAADLAVRLLEHTTASDRKSLLEYLENNQSGLTVELHIFPLDSPARKVVVRRAYESELIRSRQPQFNIRP